MRNNQAISIPETCNQSWEQMAAVNYGRHCAHCCKTVIDFTQMSNAEIIGHLATKHNICGRASQSQIDQLNDSLADKEKLHLKWRRWVAAASMIGLIGFSKADVKAKPVYTTTQAPVQKQRLPIVDTVFTTIRGRVRFSDGQKKMVNIRVWGTNIVDVTDKNGRFKLRVPLTARVLEFTGQPFLQTASIDPQNKTYYHIKLNTRAKTGLAGNRDGDMIRMGGWKVKPGQKFSKELLLRTAREIGKLDSMERLELPAPLKMPARGKI
jgi:hypothetical protein